MTPHECILVCHALASSGHLEEAKENLNRNRQCLESGEGIDLLARIELALGNEGEAKRLWNEAEKRALGVETSRKALAALDSTAWRHRALVRFLKHFLRIAAILAVVFLLGICRKCGEKSEEVGVSADGGTQVEAVPTAGEPEAFPDVITNSVEQLMQGQQ